MCLLLLFADFWLRAIETNCRPALSGKVEARFALTHAVARPHRHSETAMQPQPEPLFLADDGAYVDVTLTGAVEAGIGSCPTC